jgi:hypothetical protein
MAQVERIVVEYLLVRGALPRIKRAGADHTGFAEIKELLEKAGSSKSSAGG